MKILELDTGLFPDAPRVDAALSGWPGGFVLQPVPGCRRHRPIGIDHGRLPVPSL